MSKNNRDNICVKVLFFGAAREAAGTEEVDIFTTFPATVQTVKDAVFSRYEKVSLFARSLMISVNREYAADETAVNDLDEIAFLPPVSGG
ncbi:MAG: molybdopterin converting factor subunit 1 [Saprospiraceae bacterium]|nr:molybdopterin converting factor subunit 1 [Pyrinomonadaceae bacterium]